MNEKIWKAALYVRLSKEDGDKVESDSITNQKALIRDFTSMLPDVEIVAEMVDDGFSGASLMSVG
jgi:DNA invertase Pin-like site-specific DNA recombinase